MGPAESVARQQTAAGLQAVFSPRSVAVIGASPDPQNVGHRILASILSHGFRGPVHPIHPTATQVLARPAFTSVEQAPGDIDLAVIAVPAPAVRAVVEQCARKGVRGIVLVSAGFKEASAQGAEAERRLGEFVRAKGIRLIGPNCLGIVNADPSVRLHAIFSDTPATGGPVALMTQSGALGIALLERASRLGLGIGRFASMGNKLDVSGNDLLLHWADDPGVQVILMHLESVGNPRNFVRIARQVMRRKPIILVKGGRTAAGAKAAGSHTGAMMDADALVDAMVDQAGVVRVGSVEELFDAALALSLQPLPAGDRVAVVTNSGGPAILLADALPAGGLQLASLAEATVGSLRRRLPVGAAVANPVDMLAGATPQVLTQCLQDVLADPGVDAAVAMVTPLAPEDLPIAQAVEAAAKAAPAGKPLVAVLFGRDASSAAFRHLVQAGIPTYTFPENAAHALSALRSVARVRVRLATPAPAVQPVQTEIPSGPGWLGGDAALQVLQALGLPSPALRRAPRPEQAAEVAASIGFPVALKAEADGLVHKSDAGGVRLGLASAPEVLQAARGMWARIEAAGHAMRGFVVQRMAPDGLEMIVGAVRDPKFGPVVSVGLGGIYTEALHDVAIRLAPVSPAEADAMLASLRCMPLLRGVRGEPPKDLAALRDAVLVLGRFLDAHPHVAEIEVNPLRVLPAGQGVVAVDARLRVAP